MPGWIDLHIHTHYSDGLVSPEEVLAAARKKKLAAFAICDHDNLEGYREVKKNLRKGDPEVLSGVELSAGSDADDIHILGYGFDADSAELNVALEDFREKRNRRGRRMLERLKDLGIEVPYELVLEMAGFSAIGRPHVADAMLHMGAIGSYETAFVRYIGNGGPAYVPKENMTIQKAIALIHEAGGLAFLAHPGVGEAARHIDELVTMGLDGLEIFHPKHKVPHRRIYSKIVKDRGLLGVGGSDFHGREGKKGAIGSQPVPAEWLLDIKRKLSNKDRGTS